MSIDKNFVIKNGLEVDAGTLYVNPDTNSVGIGTTNPNYPLEVTGIIGLNDAISVGGTTGVTGQALFSTGDGAEWRALPNLRESILEVSTDGQTVFPSGTVFDHNPLFLDVFLNGVKLREVTEYASTQGNTKVQLLVPTFLGDVVELITYSGTSFASGAQGVQGAGGIDGQAGPQGTQGTDGAFAAQGIQGRQGIQGLLGLQGFEGQPGPSGIQGVQGLQGIQGDRGVQGSFGPQGNFGPQGTQGTLGLQGSIGFQGTQGTQGIQGIQGSFGVQGSTGAGLQGTQGAQGSTGIQGDSGTIGVDGAQGIQGIQGIDGATGTQGTDGAFAGQGIQGIQGLQGPLGPQGVDGAFAGQGIQGIQGLQGIIGPQGDQGIQGAQGIIGGSGIQGIQGISGPQGTQGTLGLVGNQGIQGTQGIVGPQGANATSGNFTLSESGAIARTFESKLNDSVNILDFGVVEGSGVAPSVATLNASRFVNALETERTVYIPAGTYEFSGEVLVQNKNASIFGDGERNTILKWVTSTGANGIDWTTNSAERTLTVKNVRFVAAAAKTGSPVYAKDTSTGGGTVTPNVVFENVAADYEGSTSQWAKGYHFVDCRCSYYNRVVFGGNPTLDTSYGFLFDGNEMGCIDNYLTQCQVSNVHHSTDPGAGFLFRGTGEGMHLSNSMAINCDEGVRSDQHEDANGVLQGEPFVTIQDCHFNVHETGIYFERVLQSFITGNLIFASNITVFGETLVDWTGIKFAGSSANIKCYNIIISNNIIHGGFPGRELLTDLGIVCRYADHVQIEHNQFKNCDSPGIKVANNAHHINLFSNRFQDCATPEVVNVSSLDTTVVSFGATFVNDLGGTGGGVSDIIDDTTPQLGGNLDLNGFNITGNGDINLTSGGISAVSSSENLNWGSGNFYFNSGTPELGWTSGDASIVVRAGSSSYGNTLKIQGRNARDDMAIFTTGGGAELYYNDVKKFETTDAGINVTGIVTANQFVATPGAGTPSITSPNNINLNANTVAISTNVSVGGAFNFATNNPTILGTTGTSGDIKMIGGAPFFHDGTAWREFALASGTPVSTPADTEWDNVIVRSNFDGNSTDFKFGNNPTLSNANVVGSPRKVGSGSLRIPGSNGRADYSHRTEYDFEGEWTIEMWVYLDDATRPSTGNSADCLISKSSVSFSLNDDWAILIEESAGSLSFTWKNQSNSNHNGTSGTTIWSGVAADYNQTWFHFALTRSGVDGSLHCFIDGVESSLTTGINSVVDNDINNSSSTSLMLGYAFIGGSVHDFDGFIDDFRVSTVERYTSNFTPPTTALPISGTTTTTVEAPGNISGEISFGATPLWSGDSGVTPSLQSPGNYRLTFTSSYSNATDYIVLATAMNVGVPVTIEVSRSTTHIDVEVLNASNGNPISVGALAIQVTNK